MTDLRKAAEQALEALEWNYGTDLCDIENCTAWLDKMNATISALRQALAQPDEVLAEREACAKVVESDGLARGEYGYMLTKAAARIRARGEK